MDRYKKALEKARNLVKAGLIYEDTAIQMFPELKDGKNKEDEKIIKALINLVNNYPSMDFFLKYDIHSYEVIDWLKKQGEQKPIMNVPARKVILSIWDLGNEWKELTNGCISTEYGTQLDYIQKHWHESEYYLRAKQDKQKLDKVEQKFNEGDWIISKYMHLIMQILNNDNKSYKTVETDGTKRNDSYDFIERNFKLWSIQDAKDGDILCTYECGTPKIVFILKGTPKQHYALSYHCYYNIMYSYFDSDSEKGCLSPNDEDVKPATKEQRDILIKAMTKVGYTFDFNNKEPKEIIDEKQIKKNLQDNSFRKMFE